MKVKRVGKRKGNYRNEKEMSLCAQNVLTKPIITLIYVVEGRVLALEAMLK